MKQDNPTYAARRHYLTSFTVAIVAYVALLFAGVFLDRHFHPAGAVRVVLYLLPVVPVIALIPIIVAYLRDTDEFERRMATDSLAIGGGVTALFSVTYGFLETVGFPRPSAWWTWCVLMGSWALARIFMSRRYR
ncbi:MAG TPA: hypothetical protein VMF61_03365 [Candidatus Acidoferrales bacterium]|nr:hypothetical protein [Candidatus Acidoferrales bacterium]